LPDEDGKVGAVLLSTAAGKQLLDKAYSFTTANVNNTTPSKATAMSRDAINATYGDLLKAQPQKPGTFVLNFVLDTTDLTDESKAALPALFSAVRERKPATITVFGHADASGSPVRNWKLSADRAEAAANLLRANDPSLDTIDVQFFGETKPLTDGGPGTRESRNRRVEILMF